MDFRSGYKSFFVAKINSLEKRIDKLTKQATEDEISLIKVKTSTSILSFVILYSLVLFLTSAATMYMEGAAQEVAIKYHFSESHVSLILGCRAIGLLFSLIVVAFWGKSAHKPLLSMVGVLFSSLGIILYSAPFYVDLDIHNLPTTCPLLPFIPPPALQNVTSQWIPPYYSLSLCSGLGSVSGNSSNSVDKIFNNSTNSGSAAAPPKASNLVADLILPSFASFLTPSNNIFIRTTVVPTVVVKKNRRTAIKRSLRDDLLFQPFDKIENSAPHLHAYNNKLIDITSAYMNNDKVINKISKFPRTSSYSYDRINQDDINVDIYPNLADNHAQQQSVVRPPETADQNSQQQATSSLLNQCTCSSDANLLARRQIALTILCIGSLLLGVGIGLFITVAWTYVEENVDKRKATLLYGILFTMSGLGQLIGSCFYWWFSTYVENLDYNEPVMPWIIKAWWLGMLIISILLFISFPFFLVFPKWMKEPEWSKDERIRTEYSLLKKMHLYKTELRNYREIKKAKKSKKKNKSADKNNVDTTIDGGLRDPENVGRSSHHANIDNDNALKSAVTQSSTPASSSASALGTRGVSFGAAEVKYLDEEENEKLVQLRNYLKRKNLEHITATKGLCEVLAKLICAVLNPLCLLAIAFAAYLQAGYMSPTNTYSAAQYQMQQIDAWFYTTGLSYGLAWTIGPMLGAVIIHKMKLEMKGIVIMCIILLIISIICFLINFAFSCSLKPYRTTNYTNYFNFVATGDEINSCFTTCQCSSIALDPVCSSNNNQRFPTPCHAGCLTANLVNTSIIYSNCSCTTDDVSSSFCTTSSCPIYGAYWVLILVACLAQAAGSVHTFLIFFRSVEEKYRLFSLSISLWTIILIAYIPGRNGHSALIPLLCVHG